jgi:hypothetical protein
MLISSELRRQKPRPSKCTMSLPSKVEEVVGRAVGDVAEADKVDQVAPLMEAYPKRR